MLRAKLSIDSYRDDFDFYGDYKIRYGKSGDPLFRTVKIHGESADLAFPLPDKKTSYSFAVTRVMTDPYGGFDETPRDGPTARKTAEYDPGLHWYPGGSFVWEVNGLWPDPWNRAWIEGMLSAFARADGTGDDVEIGAQALAGLASKLAAGREPSGDQLRLLDLFHPDFRRLLKAAGGFPPSEAEAAQLSRLLRGVKDLLAGRAPDKLRGADAERYKSLFGDILELLQPVTQTRPARTATPTPAATHPFKTRIPFHFNTPTPTPAVPR